MNIMTEFSPETLRHIQGLIRQAGPLGGPPEAWQGANAAGGSRVARDINTALGLTYYDLSEPAKMVQPFSTVLDGLTPRVPGRGDIATHWRTITGVNTAHIEGGVPEGIRSARITNTGQQVFATYATLGLEDDVTEEAWEAGQGLEDLRSRMGVDLLYSGKVIQERMLTSGNGSTGSGGGLGGVALGTAAAPTLSTATSGGSIADSTAVYVGVVALTNQGKLLSTIAGGVPRRLTYTSPVAESYTVSGGSSTGSAAATVTTGSSGSNANTVSAYVTAIPNAQAYAWFVGTITHQYLAAITSINSVKITAVPSAPSAPATGYASDYQVLIADGLGDLSQNALAFTGLIPYAFAYGTVYTLATGTPGTGTTMTATGAAAIAEIDHVLKAQFDATQTSPDLMFVSSQEVDTVNTLLIQNGGAPLIRFNGELMGDKSGIVPQAGVGAYFNKWSMDQSSPLIRVVLSPHMPAGTILMVTSSVPGSFYPGNNLGKLWELHLRRDWYQQEWPPRTRAYEAGVYESATLAHYFPQTLSVITNIAGIPGH